MLRLILNIWRCLSNFAFTIPDLVKILNSFLSTEGDSSEAENNKYQLLLWTKLVTSSYLRTNGGVTSIMLANIQGFCSARYIPLPNGSVYHSPHKQESNGVAQPTKSYTMIVFKIMERTIKKQRTDYLFDHKLVNPSQRGFLKKKSCVACMTVSPDTITPVAYAETSVKVVFGYNQRFW